MNLRPCVLSKRRLPSFVGSLAVAAVWPLSLIAQTAPPPPPVTPDQTVILSPFEVHGADTNGYGAQEASSSSRLNVSYLEVPQSINVVTSEFLQDTHITESHDFVQFVNNVYPRANDHQPELFFIHGLQVTHSWVDGFLSTLPVNRDAALYDRIDYVKGPASAALGRGDAGGMVNYVPKKPTGQPIDDLVLTIGDFDYYRVEIDQGNKIDAAGKMSYRIPAYFEQENNPTGGDLMHIKKYGIGPSFLWNISRNTQVFINTDAWVYNGPGIVGERYWSDPNIYRAQVSLAQIPNSPNNWDPFYDPTNPGGKGDAYIPNNRIFGFPGSGRHDTVSEFSAVIVQRFADWLSYRQGFHADDMHEYYQRFSLGVVASRDPAIPSDFLVGITDLNSQASNNSVRAQGDLLAMKDLTSDSDWLTSSHQLLLGYDMFSNFAWVYSAQQGGLYQDIYNPNYAVPLTSAGVPNPSFNPQTYVPYSANTAITDAHGNGLGYYFQYSGWFFNRTINVMYGLRTDTTAGTTYNRRNNTVIPTGQITTTVPRYSIAYKPGPDFSVYYLHSEQADPPITSAVYSNFSPSGGATAPPTTDPLYNEMITAQTKARYDELGAKAELFDRRVTGSISFFQSYRSGFILNQTLTETGYNGIGSVLYNDNYIVNGEIVHGMEAEMFGRPLPRLTLTGGCAFENGYRPGPGGAPTVYGQVGNGQEEPIESLIDSIYAYAKYDMRNQDHNGFEATFGGKFFFKDWIVSPGTYIMFDENQYLLDAGLSYYFDHGKMYINAYCNNLTNQLVYISQNSQWSLRRSYLSLGVKF